MTGTVRWAAAKRCAGLVVRARSPHNDRFRAIARQSTSGSVPRAVSRPLAEHGNPNRGADLRYGHETAQPGHPPISKREPAVSRRAPAVSKSMARLFAPWEKRCLFPRPAGLRAAAFSEAGSPARPGEEVEHWFSKVAPRSRGPRAIVKHCIINTCKYNKIGQARVHFSRRAVKKVALIISFNII